MRCAACTFVIVVVFAALAAGCGGHPTCGPDGGGGSATTAGGAGGAAGAPAGREGTAPHFSFDRDDEGFTIDTTSQSSPPYSESNLQNLGATGNGAEPPSAVFDETFGEPAVGALRITVTFNDFNQSITVRRAAAPTAPFDLSGRTLWAQLKRINEGRDFTGRARLVASSTIDGMSLSSAEGADVALTDYKWHTLVLAAGTGDADPHFDPSRVVELGLQVMSGAPPAAGPNGGPASAYGPPQSLSLYLDTVVTD